MDPIDRGGPPPRDMRAEIDHDGVTWRIGGRPALQVGSVLTLLVLGLLGSAFGPYGWLGALVGGLVPVLVFLQASQRATVRVTLRCVVVETRGLLGGRTRERLPLDEIRYVKVASATSGDSALVIGRGDTTIRVGPREPRAHLVWLCHRIAHAQALFAMHERQEGREWTFLRKVPDVLGELLDHTTDEVLRPPGGAPGKLTEP